MLNVYVTVVMLIKTTRYQCKARIWEQCFGSLNDPGQVSSAFRFTRW